MKSVAILYGFTEGRRHGHRMRKALRKAGYRVVRHPDDADILIAHSAGCFFTKDYKKATFVMLINPPYWPGKTLRKRAVERFFVDLKHGIRPTKIWFWAYKNCLNVYYGLSRFKRNWRLVIMALHFTLPKAVAHHKNVLVVRNHDDTWLSPELEAVKESQPAISIHHLSGEHDDCWRHPSRYIALLPKP
ncbi:MAG: hypothetical protein JWM81_67 [Candidatus Saccharibacteria bacterium]|nr:hypothetical protein [Candidatus Saccharibacteria bacterium]